MNKSNAEIIEKSNYPVKNEILILVKDLIKYGLVSVLALAVDVGMLYLLVDHMQVHYIYAATIAFILGLVVNYSLAKLFVFKRSKFSSIQEFVWYGIIGLIGLGLNDLIISILVWLHVWYLYAKAVSVAVVFFFNFFGRRRLFADQ